MNINTLIKSTISIWGEQHQLGKIAEESAEYIAAYYHYLDKREGSEDELINELVDLMITTWQGRIILGKDKVDAAINEKLKKLEKQNNQKREQQIYNQ